MAIVYEKRPNHEWRDMKLKCDICGDIMKSYTHEYDRHGLEMGAMSHAWWMYDDKGLCTECLKKLWKEKTTKKGK